MNGTKSTVAFGRGLLAASVLAAGAMVVVATEPSGATMPGRNGKIAFSRLGPGGVGGDIWVMNPDGSDQTQLTDGPGGDEEPVWSPDGTRIAFARWEAPAPEVWVMNADGSGQTRLTEGGNIQPTWSPDGTRIAFASATGISVMNADGTGRTNLTGSEVDGQNPDWSPDGDRILFNARDSGRSNLYSIRTDGSDRIQLTTAGSDLMGSWSPDGSRIVFHRATDFNLDVFAVDADGTDEVRLTHDDEPEVYDYWDGNGAPVWSPDGKSILFSSDREDEIWRLYRMDPDGSNQVKVSHHPAPESVVGWHENVADWQSLPSSPPAGTNGDYDGDSTTDVVVFRPSDGVWLVHGGATTHFGTTGDVPVPGDYDGDGDTDIAVFRPSHGLWFVHGGATTHFGATGDVPVPADYDGDGDTDIAVFRPSHGLWFVHGGATTHFGTAGDVPVPADYDGDGDTDVAVFRPSTNVWFVDDGATTHFGTDGDVPVPGDYDGDGDTDVAVFRPWTGARFILGQSPDVVFWGTTGDVPLPVAGPGLPL